MGKQIAMQAIETITLLLRMVLLIAAALWAAISSALIGPSWRKAHWDWAAWFAWRPVLIGWRPYWLCTIYRRPVWPPLSCASWTRCRIFARRPLEEA